MGLIYKYQIISDGKIEYFGEYKLRKISRKKHETPTEKIIDEELKIFEEERFYNLENFTRNLKNKLMTKDLGSVILFVKKNELGTKCFDLVLVRPNYTISVGHIESILSLKKVFERDAIGFKVYLF